MSNRQKGLFCAVLTPVLWGLMSAPIRSLRPYGIVGPDLAFFRCAISGTGLLLYYYITNRSALKVDPKGLLICALYGCFCYGTSFTAYNICVSRIPLAVAVVLMFLCPIWVSIFNLIIFKERLKMINTVSIVICMIGAVLVSNLVAVSGERIDMLGVILAIINSLGAGLQLIIPRAFDGKYQRDSFIVYGFLGAAVALSVFTNFGVIGTAVGQAPSTVIGNLFFLCVICTLIANTSFVNAGKYIDSTLVGIISALEVVVGSLLGYIAYHEVLSAAQTFGAVIIVIGALLPNIVPMIQERRTARQ